MHEFSLGIDIGGTFTDIVLLDVRAGQHYSHKELTTAQQPEVGVMRGVQTLLARCHVQTDHIVRVVHATTLFTNALIERRGARTGLITTQGFRDVLEIGRERRYDLYDNFLELIPPLVPRDLRLEVAERMGPDGQPIHPLDETDVLACAQQLVSQGVESIAVAFLHAYQNPDHEMRAAKLIAHAYPALAVSFSAEVAAEIREYERFSTTVANAYVKPLADRYISLLQTSLYEYGITAPLFFMQSNGGLIHTQEAKRIPVQLLESGPAAGALVAAHFAQEIKEARILAFDMGGTTAKLSVIDDGQPLVAYRFEAARQKRFRSGSGLPINISTIELIEIGAGGGSIAYKDDLGLLKVGPRSAGSEPGPACYDKGGTQPTVTDANLLLGYLNPDTFAGGTMKIRVDATEQAIGTLSQDLDLNARVCASGIVDIVNENMAAAARVHIAERGADARRYALLVTGGGGPLHGYSIARKLRLRRMLCPPSAGVASALGLLIAPPKVTQVKTIARRLSALNMPQLQQAYETLEASARAIMAESGVNTHAVISQRYADMRFIGQGFELVTELPVCHYDESFRQLILETFVQAYKKVFSITPPIDDAEIVNVRIALSGKPDSAFDARASGETQTSGTVTRTRQAYCPDRNAYVRMPVLRRTDLHTGRRVAGPAIVEESASTLIVGSDGMIELLPNGVISIELYGEETV